MAIVEPAPAKINLALHVRRRRADGYHEIETLFAFLRDGDSVSVAPAEADSFAVTGPFAGALAGGADNLVLTARDAFARRIAPLPPLAITLDKHLPVASGIGGGSADAAATLRALARLSGVGEDRLADLALSLGSDVPACLVGKSALGAGRGEQLVEIALPPLPILLINPLVAVPTAAVFTNWNGVDGGPLVRHPGLVPGSSMPHELSPGSLGHRECRDAPGMADWFKVAIAGRNDLQISALQIAPIIGDVLDRLSAQPGVTLARMSGSGATCFALFDNIAARSAARAAIERAEPGWWYLESTLA